MGYANAIKTGCRACESLFAKAPLRHTTIPEGFVKAAKAGEVKICPNFKSAIGDTVSISHKSPLSEIKSYLEGVTREGKDFKPIFENPDSAFAKYFKDKTPRYTVSIHGFKNYLFDNADKINVTKDEYWQLVDKIAMDLKKETQLDPRGLRQEFVENSDKILKWTEIFKTQKYDKVTKQNIYNRFYDEKMFNQAIKEYTEFVEKITGKKVLIGCPSRMRWSISALGMFNNPNAYKDFDYILLGHGKGSSLITDITHPDTWRFADNEKSIWEYIEKNIPKDKKALVFCCETDGLEKAGKIAGEMIDRQGQQMYGIGYPVSGWFELTDGPAKICKSGTRHIIGQVSEETIYNSILEQPTLNLAEWPMTIIKDPKTMYYDLDYTPYMVENLVK